MAYKRPQIAIGLCALVGILTMIPFFFGDVPDVRPLGTQLSRWASVLAAFMVLWGAVNVIQYNGQIVRRKVDREGRKDYIWSAYLLLLILATTLIGVLGGKNHEAYLFINSYIMGPISESMFAILVYYVFAAGYRAVRVRTWEVGFIIAISLIIVIRQTPIFQTFGGPLGIVALGDWISGNLSSATLRAINIGFGFATIVLMYKVFLGRETGWLGRTE